MGASARSFVGFPVFSSVSLVSVSLEILRSVLVSVSLCSRAKTLAGYLCFFFRF